MLLKKPGRIKIFPKINPLAPTNLDDARCKGVAVGVNIQTLVPALLWNGTVDPSITDGTSYGSVISSDILINEMIGAYQSVSAPWYDAMSTPVSGMQTFYLPALKF